MKVQIQAAQKIILVMPDGTEYPVTKPTLGSQIELEGKLEAAKKDGSEMSGTQMVLDHLTSCGLPIEAIKTLDVDQLQAIQDVLKPAKKN